MWFYKKTFEFTIPEYIVLRPFIKDVHDDIVEIVFYRACINPTDRKFQPRARVTFDNEWDADVMHDVFNDVLKLNKQEGVTQQSAKAKCNAASELAQSHTGVEPPFMGRFA